VDTNQTALLITAIASVALGMIVWQRMPDRVWNRLFAIHATGGGLWTFLNFLIMSSDTPATAELWLRLTHPLVAMVICTCVDFAWTFPERAEFVDSRRRITLYAIGALFGSVAFAPGLIESIVLQPGAVAVVDVEYGATFVPFALFTVFALAYADFVLLRKAMVLRGVQRVQVIYVLAGLAGSHIVAIVTILVIPVVWGTTAYSGWGAGGYVITLAGMSYAIAKHRLMRPQAGLRRLGGAAVAVAVVLGIAHLSLGFVNTHVAREEAQTLLLGAGIVLGILFIAVQARLHQALEGSGSAERSVAATHERSATHVLRTLDARELLDFLARTLVEHMDVTRAVVYLRSDDGDDFVPRAWRTHNGSDPEIGVPDLAAANPLISTIAAEIEGGTNPAPLSLDTVRRFSSLGEARLLGREFDQLGVQLIAPMIWEEQLIGLVAVGPKESGDMYDEEDYAFSSHMALQASLALNNARLYAESLQLKDFLESILREMDNAVVVTNTDFEVVVFNNAAERLFGIPVEEATGAHLDVLPPGVANCIRATLSSARVLSNQHTFVRRSDDRAVPVACSVSPLLAEGAVSGGAIAVVSDLTLTRELERERREAERLSLIRVIAAGMAHEIRNPLVAIRTFTELAPDRMDDPEFRTTFLTVAQQEIDRIDKLVGDLMSLSKPADAVVEPVPIDLICKQVVSSVSGITEARSINMTLETAELSGLPMGDAARIHQAILNLVTNALDEEPEDGTVRLTTTEAIDAEGNAVVVIRVFNAASYVEPAQLENIFRPFYSRKERGTGLGLAICQTIVEEHGGEISVASTPGSGTEFSIRLPLNRVTAAATPAGEATL